MRLFERGRTDSSGRETCLRFLALTIPSAMCLPARLAESRRHIKQSPCLQAATDACVSCELTLSSANLHDSHHVVRESCSSLPGAISEMISTSSKIPILLILSRSSLLPTRLCRNHSPVWVVRRASGGDLGGAGHLPLPSVVVGNLRGGGGGGEPVN